MLSLELCTYLDDGTAMGIVDEWIPVYITGIDGVRGDLEITPLYGNLRPNKIKVTDFTRIRVPIEADPALAGIGPMGLATLRKTLCYYLDLDGKVIPVHLIAVNEAEGYVEAVEVPEDDGEACIHDKSILKTIKIRDPRRIRVS
jgi:hypothetical protein